VKVSPTFFLLLLTFFYFHLWSIFLTPSSLVSLPSPSKKPRAKKMKRDFENPPPRPIRKKSKAGKPLSAIAAAPSKAGVPAHVSMGAGVEIGGNVNLAGPAGANAAVRASGLGAIDQRKSLTQSKL
jgi:hypothetical protein